MPAKITVNKQQLLLTLQANMAAHKDEYEKAVEVYRERFVEQAQRFAEDAILAARRHQPFVQFGWLPVPEEHTEDYQRAIEMLEWEIEDEVTLTEVDFGTLVQNQWGWARSFAQNTSSYVAR